MSNAVVPIPPAKGLVVDGKEISSSLEDYLETILYLSTEQQVARAKDIGAQLHVNRSSVTTALHALAKRGLVNYSPYDFVTLTESGQKAAEDVAQRHVVLREFFSRVLRIEDEQANAAACQMEHALAPVVLERLASFLDFVNRCPQGFADFSPEMGFHCRRKQSEPGCGTCDNNNACETTTR